VLGRECDERRSLAWSLIGLGSEAASRGDFAAAHAMLEESTAIAEEVGDRWCLAWSLCSLGDAARANGSFTEALAKLERAAFIGREMGDALGLARTLSSLGEVLHGVGNTRRALETHREGLELAVKVGNRSTMAASFAASARTLASQGNMERAALSFGAAYAIRKLIHFVVPPVEAANEKRALSSVKRQLGPSGFTIAMARGSEMALEPLLAELFNSALQRSNAAPT